VLLYLFFNARGFACSSSSKLIKIRNLKHSLQIHWNQILDTIVEILRNSHPWFQQSIVLHISTIKLFTNVLSEKYMTKCSLRDPHIDDFSETWFSSKKPSLERTGVDFEVYISANISPAVLSWTSREYEGLGLSRRFIVHFVWNTLCFQDQQFHRCVLKEQLFSVISRFAFVHRSLDLTIWFGDKFSHSLDFWSIWESHMPFHFRSGNDDQSQLDHSDQSLSSGFV
jgi:hypothetical protein